MVRIAILADIHGNLPAFEVVQADIQACAPDRVIVNGDVLNRGPQSLECLEAVRATGWTVVYGNHEDYAIKRRSGVFPQEWAVPFYAPFQAVAEALSEEQAAYVSGLPRWLVIQEPGLPALHITHGSPLALNDGLGPWLSESELLERAEQVPEPVLIGAHTHRPFDRWVHGHWVLNCSAVGVPYNGDPRAQYLLLTGGDGVWRAEFRAVPYDRGLVYAAYRQSGGLQHLINRIFQYEIETATFHFGAYVRFCKQRGLAIDSSESFAAYRQAARKTQPGRPLKPTSPHPEGK